MRENTTILTNNEREKEREKRDFLSQTGDAVWLEKQSDELMEFL